MVQLAFLSGVQGSCEQIDQGLTEVPADIPAGCVEVILEYNEITQLPSAGFGSLPQCTALFLGFKQISLIENGAFAGFVDGQEPNFSH